MGDSNRSRFQIGLRSILLLISVLSFCLALTTQGQLATLIFLLCMPLWGWTCIHMAMGCVVILSNVLDALMQKPAEIVAPARRRWPISLRALLIALVVVGATSGLLVKVAIDHFNRPTPDKGLYNEFVATNPSSLDGWEITKPGPDRRWLTWSRDRIAYFDRDKDGKPDMKYREHPRLSETAVWWEDTDYDGMFDTEVVVQGSFHFGTRPLKKTIPVPHATRD